MAGLEIKGISARVSEDSFTNNIRKSGRLNLSCHLPYDVLILEPYTLFTLSSTL